jgi:branched-chain amino acid aminotransferase
MAFFIPNQNFIMSDWVWINGVVSPREEAGIAAMDRGFLLGEGFFETMAIVNGRIWKAAYHLERLQQALDYGRIPWTTSVEGLHNILHALPDLPSDGHGVFRLTVSAGRGPRGLLRSDACTPTVMAFVDPPPTPGGESVRCIWSSVRRNEYSPVSRFKSTNYLDAIFARREAADCGADDALMMNMAGHATCFSAANLLAWDRHHLMIPSVGSGALPGTTLRVLEAHLSRDPRWLPAHLSRWHLGRCAGVFRLNTLSLLQPLDRLEDMYFDPEATTSIAEELGGILRASVLADCGEHSGPGVLPW